MSNRRNFIKSSALLSVAGIGLQGCVKSEAGSKQKPNLLIMGHGDHKYRLDKEWAIQDFNKYPVQNCHEMVMDSKGRLIMTNTDVRNNILIFNKDGKVLDSWTGNWPGVHGLTLKDEGGEEFLYITDSDVTHEVYKTTLDGKILLTMNFPKEVGIYEKKEEFKPTETAIAANGDIYVADGYGKNYIIVYDSQGKYKFHFGGKGDSDDLFETAHGITIDTRGGKEPELLITSRGKNEFKRFSMDGKHIETIKMPGYSMCRPVLKGDNLYFAILATETWWSYDGMVAVLDKDNKLISLPGSTILPVYKDGIVSKPKYVAGTFLNPHDVCIDNDDNIYVPQWYSGMTYPYRLERV